MISSKQPHMAASCSPIRAWTPATDSFAVVVQHLLRAIVDGTTSPAQVIAAVRGLAPESARYDRSHAWWDVDGKEILEVLGQVARGQHFRRLRDAVAVATRTRGRVVRDTLFGLRLFRVLSEARAEQHVTAGIVAEAMPAEFVDPPWDDDLPTLRMFRELAEHVYLRRLLAKHHWNLSAAAREAAISRQSLYGLLERHRAHRPSSDGKPDAAAIQYSEWAA